METYPDDLPGPLEAYCSLLDAAFTRPTQRDSFRRYLQGLLMSAERNKTATGLANTEPGKTGSKHKAAQRLQWFLSESSWNPDALHQARLALMRELPTTKSNQDAVLVVDETGDRNYGTHTAHVGRQYLGSLGKVDSGVVSVHLLYATEQTYFPLGLKPYTPASHYQRKDRDPEFKTKPRLALELLNEFSEKWPFRAVLADSLYGRNDRFQHQLSTHFIPFVMALPASYTWWHREGEAGGVEELAHIAAAKSWLPLVRTFADEHQEVVWVAELDGKVFGPAKTLRLIVVTNDPVMLPDATTEYLISNLRVSEDDQHEWHAKGSPASPHEIALLYARRVVIEQAYREVKQHLGWAQYQARSSLAIQRHWALVCTAFCFLWWDAQLTAEKDKDVDERTPEPAVAAPMSWSALLRRVRGWLEPFVWMWRYWRAFSRGAPPRQLSDLLEKCRRGGSLYLYVT